MFTNAQEQPNFEQEDYYVYEDAQVYHPEEHYQLQDGHPEPEMYLDD